MSKTFTGNYFEDFELGQELLHGTPRTITQGDVSLYVGLTGSRFDIHCAETVANACGFAAAPIDNLLLFHVAFGKTVPEISLNAVANLGYAECRFWRPAFAGDTVEVSSKVIGLKENSNGKTGVVYVHSTAVNQHHKLLVEWKRWVMVHKREAIGATMPSSVPDLSSVVHNIDEIIPESLSFSQYDNRWSSSPYRFNDYDVGEIIDHIDGLTINDSDHSIATRLYQNNAKVHFDQHLMSQSAHGKRLVYGGHIISMCRALTHNGLANGLWLAAINGGAHVNPSFTGDTIYAQSQIVDKGNIDGRSDLGWLRVKTYGVKNNSKFSLEHYLEKRQAAGGSLPKYDTMQASLVLELDYTLLMPV